MLSMGRQECHRYLQQQFPSATTKVPSYRAGQLFQQIHKEAEGISYLPKHIIEKLKETHRMDKTSPFAMEPLRSIDGTRKYLFDFSRLPENEEADIESTSSTKRITETVVIPEGDRVTLCVSSQIGCSLRCTFCNTGQQKLVGNLETGEIIRQLTSLPAVVRKSVTNIVFMGQGEPLYNGRNVFRAVEILTDPSTCYSIPPSKITISTSGIAPLIPEIAKKLKVSLAVSLHAPTDTLRDRIMGINRTYPIATLMQACKDFQKESNCSSRRITFEYVMLRGVNDSDENAHLLVRLLKENFMLRNILINIIPYNGGWEGSVYECSDRIDLFISVLKDSHIPCFVRKSRGQDIFAACGQLRSVEGAELKKSVAI